MDLKILSPVASAINNNRMDVDDENIHLVNPGETVTTDQQFMRGHGTYTEGEGVVVSSVAGTVERVNKLLSVRPLKTRYTPEIGDIVVGRVTEVAMRRWKVDANARQDANLLLSSVSLPGGVQRRKNEADELQMRQFFTEGDMLVAEVQAFYADGTMGLHTRGFKFCKLRNGSFVCVPPVLVQRCKSQFHSLPCGVDVILGLNGYIWVHKKFQGVNTDDTDPTVHYSSVNDDITEEERKDIARVSNCISALARQYMHINDTVIVYTYEASLQYSIRQLLDLDVIEAVTSEASLRMRAD
ncbi:exosome component 2-like protein [Gilbertella persicaria]|uniref:Exosome non-catalytic core subunit rrp4 n=1 Tax=Rhizopus stolonifer TaxID=4846 RepID=A0A367KLJ7_RHIST|nr:exosome component 2-like protein [Gilbertella persicaria]KAI8084348.1 exosome component 2-like protein [Gilbertella persicaria]RCI03021.1 exosome non-catalytic core subunit rrp4 [Rhizopus stolonifer]